ncbi:unnamed protein product [Pseudo-nitzschia multistriata]|uniref:Major facilitator superfamily (MFS) profile domain-containing protein n=1 Tax=Pseudo-nitzschia multistriata TaxID=183589 RepID=A0A448ZMU9_9STRA|nr:unnamed protein product [Pseudo-nitzschia multistriata]
MGPRERPRGDEPETTESTPLISNATPAAIVSVSSEATPGGDSDPSSEARKHKEWLTTTSALSFSLLVQSYLLVSVFPYSGFLSMHLIEGLTEETAGSYAGLIASSFMAGRTFSSFEWGKAADRYGRVSVIKASLLLSAVFSLLFGLAGSFPMALALRFLLGVCNGLIGPIKTLVSEYAHGDQTKETKTMGIVLGMWGYGFLINPAISGYLSDPAKQYPEAELVEAFRPWLEEYPFFLPNLVGCGFCLVGYALTHAFVTETLPEEKRQPFRLVPSIGLWSWIEAKTSQNPKILRTVSSWGLFKHLHSEDGEISENNWSVVVSPTGGQGATDGGGDTNESRDDGGNTATIASLLQRNSTRQHLLVYWVYSFLIITLDEIFPLFCISKTSGLGVTEKIIGNILSGTGLVYVAMQYFLLTGLVNRFGFYTALTVSAALSVPTGIWIPLSLVTNEGAAEGALNGASLAYLSIVYAFIRAFSSVVFSTITMLLNRTVPAHQRGTMNGLSMLGGSLAKACGPLFGGVLFSRSVNSVTPPFGSVLVYGIMSALGGLLVLQTTFLRMHGDVDDEPAQMSSSPPPPKRFPEDDPETEFCITMDCNDQEDSSREETDSPPAF